MITIQLIEQDQKYGFMLTDDITGHGLASPIYFDPDAALSYAEMWSKMLRIPIVNKGTDLSNVINLFPKAKPPGY